MFIAEKQQGLPLFEPLQHCATGRPGRSPHRHSELHWYGRFALQLRLDIQDLATVDDLDVGIAIR